MPSASPKAAKMFHATMHVTRLEEWCVEAANAEEAKRLLERGEGHRCNLGDCVHLEVTEVAN